MQPVTECDEEKLILTSIKFAEISTSVVRHTVCRQNISLEHVTLFLAVETSFIKKG
jgi:hypothetical protein